MKMKPNSPVDIKVKKSKYVFQTDQAITLNKDIFTIQCEYDNLAQNIFLS